MKLAVSDGKELKEVEVFDQNGHVMVAIDNQTFEFEFPDIEAEIVAFTEEGPLLLLEDELELLESYRGEAIQLVGNPFHDAGGRFAARAGSGLKSAASKIKSKAVPFAQQSSKRIAKSAVTGAAFGAVAGGIGGAAKGFFKGDPNEGSILTQTKQGLIKGAIQGAKKGAIKAVIRTSFGIGSELAGDYGWVVKSVGGLAVSQAGRKMNFGLNEKELSGISKELFVGGFADLAGKVLETNEAIILDESKFSRGLAELAYAIADALEQNPDTEGIGFENTPELGVLGFQEEDGLWYIEREKAEELLSALTAYAEVKLETINEVIQLVGNPYHDAFGRFATAQNFATASRVTGYIGRVAGISKIIASSIVNTRVNQVYKKEGGPAISVGDYFSSKGRTKISKVKQLKSEIKDQVLKENVYSKVIGGKQVSVTYGQIDRAGSILGAIGLTAQSASLLFWVGASTASEFEYNQRNREYHQRQQAKKQSAWPPQATQKDFQKMYRTVARRYHPDIGGNTATMQKINAAYAAKDWSTINDLYTQLEAYFLENDFTPEQAETLGLLIKILKQALDDGAEFVIFPVEDEGELEPFVVIDGEMVLDRPTVELIVDAFIGREDAGTDQS